MNPIVRWLVIASAIAGTSPRHPEPAEISITLRSLSQARVAKTRFWYGEPIRFDLSLTSEAQPAIRVRMNGTRNPLFPLGNGLLLRRGDGKSFRFGLTPMWHHLPETSELRLSRIAAAYTLMFPDYSDASQHQYKLLPTAPPDGDKPDRAAGAQASAEWQSGAALVPPGTYTVTFTRRAQRTQGTKWEPVELRSNSVVLTVRE